MSRYHYSHGGNSDWGSSGGGSKANEQQNKIRDLEKRLDHLTIYVQAMWELIRENTRLEDSDIEVRVQEIDLRDGKADGKINALVRLCPACERKNSSTKKQCIYCGADLPREHIFES